MAPSPVSPRLLLASGLLAGVLAAPSPAAQGGALVPPCNEPVVVKADSEEADAPTKTVVLTNVTITQCALRLQADRARGTAPMGFTNSQWTFVGHVRMEAEHRGSLESDEAVVDFRDNRIAHATATGKPAQFEQYNETQQIAHGHADQIVYDVEEGTLRLRDNAYLSNGANEISSGIVVYNIRAQSVQAAKSPGSDQGVHLVIMPDGASPPAPAAHPGTKPPAKSPP
jgi:lipopolysaccharide transport protein LptA